MWVQIYKIIRLVLIIFTFSYFLGIIWHILVVDVFPPKDIYDTNNFYLKFLASDDEKEGKVSEINFVHYDRVKRLVKLWYFAFTTLSTIGFGDFSPQSTKERFIAVFILLFGVSVFSFIIGQFIEIMRNYKSLWAVGHHKDLSKWISLLSRFNNGNPLKKEMITEIEDFFNFYWENNRMFALASERDLRFMNGLPVTIQQQILVDYLFSDFLYKYKSYFTNNFYNPNDIYIKKKDGEPINKFKIEQKEASYRRFLSEFVKKLEPRIYDKTKNDII